eukprot:16613_1
MQSKVTTYLCLLIINISVQGLNTYCNNASQCVGQSIVLSAEYGDYLYGQGYKSIFGSSSSINGNTAAVNVKCYGSFACYETSFIHASSITCRGAKSCANVSDMSYFINNTYLMIRGYGVSSLSYSTIFAGSNIYVYCYGYSSCSYTNIINATRVYGQGSFSLYKSTLINPRNVYFNGYLSGYATNIICTENNICNISSSFTNYFGTKFNCSGICNFFPERINTTYSYIKLNTSRFNFTTIATVNDALCSNQSNDMTFDNSQEKLHSGIIPINYDSKGPLCCRGYQSCKGTDMTFNSPTEESIICSGDKSCDHAIIDTAGSVYCEGSSSCINSNSIRALSIYCLGRWSCKNSNIINTSVVYCSGYQSCELMDFTISNSIGFKVYLLGKDAGLKAVFNFHNCSTTNINECSMECLGNDACNDAS